jgi:hypothetical protein
MASNTGESSVPIYDISGAINRTPTKFMTSQNQVELSINAQFDRIGGTEKVPGYTKLGNTITTSSTSTSTSSTSTSTSTSSSTSTSTSTSSTTTS